MIDLRLAQSPGEIDCERSIIAVEDDRPEGLAALPIAGRRRKVAIVAGADRDLAVGEAGLADRLESRGDVERSVPVDGLNADVNRRLTICLAVRLGNAWARRATAPEIAGAEKLVPDHRNSVPVWSGARSLTPTAIR